MDCMLKPLTVPEVLEGLPATEESALSLGCPPGAFRSKMQPGLTSEMEQPASSFCRLVVVVVIMNLQKIILHKQSSSGMFLLTVMPNDAGSS